MKNQDETDIDCGGSHCGKCADGSFCNIPSDCINYDCRSQVCQCKYPVRMFVRV